MFKSMLIKEFLLVSRDKHALAALFIMPAVFILIMSLALKDVFNEQKAMLSLLIINHSETASSLQLITDLQENMLINSELVDANIAVDIDQQKAQFLIVIPQKYGEEEIPLQVEVASDVSQTVLLLFKAQIMQTVVKQKFTYLQNKLLDIASQMGVSPDDSQSIAESDIINLQYAKLDENTKPTSTQQSVPSWIVFGLFFVIIPMSTIFISERKQNTLMRLSAMNITIPVLFAGKIIPYVIINQLQVWMMIAVGVFIVPLFGADALTISGSVPALIVLSLALSLAAIGLSILIATLVDSIEQATTIGGIINILLGAIGGVMVPKFVMPEFMQEFANISPMSWGLEGYLDLFLRGGDFAEVANEILALSCFGLIALLIASVVFKIKIRKVS